MPQVALNINVPENNIQIVKPEHMVNLVENISKDLEEEKKEVSEAYNNFAEMVFNSGDATSASKEALVNLLKLRTDLVDKKTRLAEMMLKVMLKDQIKNVTAHQHNDIHINKKDILKELNQRDKELNNLEKTQLENKKDEQK